MLFYGERLNEKSRGEQFKQLNSDADFVALQNTERFRDFFAKVPLQQRPKNYGEFTLFLAKREKDAAALISDKGEIALCWAAD
jgi:hypothetical protein